MKTCNTDYEELLPGILGPLLGGGVFVLRPVPTYPDTIVYEASARDRSIVFKAMEPGGRDPDVIAVEAWACERAREGGVPAPAVLEVDTGGARFPSSFFVMEKAEGESLASLDVPDWEQAAILEPYYRTGTAAAIPGVGLGLAISHALMQQMGGALIVESEMGVGSSFAIRLPIAGSLSS